MSAVEVDKPDGIDPDWSQKGVPMCSTECRQHDGKRCRILGHRPDAICEPAVVWLSNKARKGDE